MKLGERVITGKIVSLDEENIEKLDKMAENLKQVEKNLKENIVSNMK